MPSKISLFLPALACAMLAASPAVMAAPDIPAGSGPAMQQSRPGQAHMSSPQGRSGDVTQPGNNGKQMKKAPPRPKKQQAKKAPPKQKPDAKKPMAR